MDASGLLFLGLIVVVFYLTMMRPQQKRIKQHRALVSSVAPGDEIITIGGLHGVVKELDDDVIWLEIAPGTSVKFSRLSVSRKVEIETEAPSTEPSTEED